MDNTSTTVFNNCRVNQNELPKLGRPRYLSPSMAAKRMREYRQRVRERKNKLPSKNIKTVKSTKKRKRGSNEEPDSDLNAHVLKTYEEHSETNMNTVRKMGTIDFDSSLKKSYKMDNFNENPIEHVTIDGDNVMLSVKCEEHTAMETDAIEQRYIPQEVENEKCITLPNKNIKEEPIATDNLTSIQDGLIVEQLDFIKKEVLETNTEQLQLENEVYTVTTLGTEHIKTESKTTVENLVNGIIGDQNSFEGDVAVQDFVKDEPRTEHLQLENDIYTIITLENENIKMQTEASLSENPHGASIDDQTSFEDEISETSTEQLLLETEEYTVIKKENESTAPESEEKLFACTECNRRFLVKESLDRHMRQHSSKKPFTCTKSPSNTSSTDISFSSTSINCADIKTKLITGQYTLKFSKRGTSKVWEMFGTIKVKNGTELQNIVACKKCYGVLKLFSKSTSNLTRHKCYKNMRDNLEKRPKCDVDFDMKKEAARVVTAWTVQNCRSFKIIDDNGLKKFAELMISIGARYGENVDVSKLLPHPTTISRNIDNLYKMYSDNIKRQLGDSHDTGYALTTNIWTDNYSKASYISITIHYIKESTLFRRLIGLKSMEFEPCTNDQIREKVQEALTDFNCDLNNAITVTEKEKNMIAAFRTYDHIFCIIHLLHDIIEKSLQDVPILNELCNKCDNLVKYFKKSVANSELAATLNGLSPTCWNTVYYLLNSIEKNWLDIKNILQEKNQIHRVDGIDISLVTAVSKVLKFFEETSKQLEGDTYPTLHLTIPHVYRLKRLCAVSNEDCETVKTWKDHLNILLERTVVNNLTIFHKIALFLYPPTNKLTQFSTEEKNIVKTECNRIMGSYDNNMFTNQSSDITEQIPNETIDLFGAFMERTEDLNINEKINNEIQSYENIKRVFASDFDVLQWWYLNRLQYPLLYKLSCKIFAVPATSASSERALTHARNLISEKRCLIGSNSAAVNKILFIYSNTDASQLSNLID